MSSRNYIAVDLGAESGRVMRGAVSAEGILLEEVHRFANVPVHVPGGSREGTLHWTILELWREIKVGLQKAVERGGEISGVGVDTWGVDFALMDAAGAMLGPPVCYRDPRTRGMVEAVYAKLSREKVYGVTGIQTMALNTLFQLASLSFNHSAQLKAAAHLLFLPDLLTYWMCGRMGTEYTIASTSQMLDARTRQFSVEILGALGISAALFPRIDVPGSPLSIRGLVLPEVNEALAAGKVPVIAVGSHDTASAVAAVPADGTHGDWLYLSSGTWSLLGCEVEEPVLSEKAAGYNITNEGGVGGKIRLLKNIAGLFLLQECRRSWAREGGTWDYAALTQMAGKARGHVATLDLEDGVFATAGDMPGKIAEHCRRTGQRVPEGPGEMTRVILESLAVKYAKVVRELSEVTGRAFKRLHIVGGGSQNDLLNQMAADATGMTVLAGPVEATALGNVMMQGIATGAIGSLEAGRRLVGRSVVPRVFEPRR